MEYVLGSVSSSVLNRSDHGDIDFVDNVTPTTPEAPVSAAGFPQPSTPPSNLNLADIPELTMPV